uniref:Uncharacterized protein n=1 Tax=Spongospora subterranea TaxID=70186 RepID=A0A0H5R8D2_9EUKA|eukprot:CRZ10393.1 hypothetical protein [Spongospora subterranea]
MKTNYDRSPGGYRVHWGIFLIGVGAFVLLLQLYHQSEEAVRQHTLSTLNERIGIAESLLIHPPTGCHLLPRANMFAKDFFQNLEPDHAPDFSLLSAWLKPEYPSAVVAPREIPEIYKDAFTMGGSIPVTEFYFNQAYLGNIEQLPSNVWTKVSVEEYMESTKTTAKYGSDGLNINIGLEKYNIFVAGKRGIVIGSEHPWVEAMALRAGSGPILTVEFGKIVSEHPMISTMVPKEFTEKFLNGAIKPFDYGISFSSLEHDGLGRYGDILNPIGDLQSMAKALSYIKPGGFFFLGLMNGDDSLAFNAHRVYGKIRMPKIMAGWHFVDVIMGGGQHLVIMQNRNGCL